MASPFGDGPGEAARSVKVARVALHRCVKGLAAGVDALRPTSPGVVALLYHRVGERSAAHEIDLPTPLFREQMAEIADRAATLDEALDALERGEPGKGDVVVTFDDGTTDFLDEALPVLVEHRVPVVLYVATAFVDEGRAFPNEGHPVSWCGLRDAMSTGLVTIGSHTHTHALLERCTPMVAAQECDRSIDLIGSQLGVAPRHFAYPKALPGTVSIAAEVAVRFRSAAVAGTRSNRYGKTNPYRLARSPIQRSDGMRWFRRKVAGGMMLEDDMRRVANRFRYAGATT